MQRVDKRRAEQRRRKQKTKQMTEDEVKEGRLDLLHHYHHLQHKKQEAVPQGYMV